MAILNYTLIADGSSDKALLNIIKWVLDDLYPKLANKGAFADFRRLPNPPLKGQIVEQLTTAIKYYPADLFFYHRDAELISNNIINQRKAEIFGVVENAYNIVCIVPIVMMESWLLFDEVAIKKAAENKNFSGDMKLPPINTIEKIREPKIMLHDLLKKVSCKKKRNLGSFNINKAVHLVSENITDFSPLRKLNAFLEFEKDLIIAVNKFAEK